MNYLLVPNLDEDLILVFTLILGAIFGALVCYFMLKHHIQREYQLMFEKWMLDAEKNIRKDALGKSRAVLKGKIGEQLAPILPNFRYNPADARFIGSPIDYVIFDGYSEAMEGNGKIRKIVLMDVKTGKAKLTPVQEMIRETATAGDVDWETLVINENTL